MIEVLFFFEILDKNPDAVFCVWTMDACVGERGRDADRTFAGIDESVAMLLIGGCFFSVGGSVHASGGTTGTATIGCSISGGLLCQVFSCAEHLFGHTGQAIVVECGK